VRAHQAARHQLRLDDVDEIRSHAPQLDRADGQASARYAREQRTTSIVRSSGSS
jgi:hypothetical protein